MTYTYFLKTGYIFEGTEEEFKEKLPSCSDKSLPMTDEEGCFCKWYCMIDWAFCDKQCNKHRPKLNEDIAEFFWATCERYKDANKQN
jgi:hypothetical protein